MSVETGGTPARDRYTAALEPRLPRQTGSVPLLRRVTRAVVRAVSVGLSVALGDFATGSSEHDLVVRRRSDGGEAMRTDAGSIEEAGLLEAHVLEQLDTLTVAEFNECWRITVESGTE